MYYIGIDVHLHCSSVEILNVHGALHQRFTVRGSRAKLVARIEAEAPRPYAVVFEASCGYGYLYDALADQAQRVEVAHPGHLRLIFRSKQKTDRIDASKLAKLLFLGAVPQVHVPPASVRSGRALVELRQRLLSGRVGVQNRLKALLRGLGIEYSHGSGLWTKEGVRWLRALPLEELDAFRRDTLLAELRRYTRQVRRVNDKLLVHLGADPRLRLLRTIPGIGLHTAAAFLVYIDQIQRFRRVRQVGSYFGMVPRQDTSAGHQRLGHITKDGPSTMRKLLCEAGWSAIRHSARLRARYQRLLKQSGDRRKLALVALGHHLLRVMAAMLRSGEVWREEELSAPPATAQT